MLDDSYCCGPSLQANRPSHEPIDGRAKKTDEEKRKTVATEGKSTSAGTPPLMCAAEIAGDQMS
jgi:hypothetical protein